MSNKSLRYESTLEVHDTLYSIAVYAQSNGQVRLYVHILGVSDTHRSIIIDTTTGAENIVLHMGSGTLRFGDYYDPDVLHCYIDDRVSNDALTISLPAGTGAKLLPAIMAAAKLARIMEREEYEQFVEQEE